MATDSGRSAADAASGHQPTASAASCTASSQSGVPNAVTDKLREARALIEKGWTKGYFSKQTPFGICYCVDGALIEVADFKGPVGYSPLVRCFEAANGIPPFGVWEWNDAPARTQEDVLAAFDKAIAAHTVPAPVTSDTWVKPDAYLTDIETVEA